MNDGTTHTDADAHPETPADAAGGPLILHVRTVTGTGGGPDKTILNSPRFLQRHGLRCCCAFLHPPGDRGFAELQRRAEQAGATVLSVPDRGAADLRSLWQLVQFCRREGVALWHGHDYKSNAFGLLARRLHRMRLVTTVHGWVRFTKRTPLYYAIDRAAIRRHDRVVCVSDDLAARCVEGGTPSDRTVLIENAIDTDLARRQLTTREAKVRLGVRPEVFLVGGVGRLSPEKGFDLLIQAVAALVASGIDAELVIAGDGDDRSRLATLIAAQPDPSRFRLLGHQAEVGELFQALDAFALSSLREGLPNVVLEAMAYEAPIVATRIAGVPRLIEDGRTGLLVEAGDAAGLAAALRQLATDQTLSRNLAAAARTRVHADYSFARRMEKMVAVYQSLGVTGREG